MKKLFLCLLAVMMLVEPGYAKSAKKKAFERGEKKGKIAADAIAKTAQANRKLGETTYNTLDMNSAKTVSDSQKGKGVAKVIEFTTTGIAVGKSVECGGQNYEACGFASVMWARAKEARRCRNRRDISVHP